MAQQPNPSPAASKNLEQLLTPVQFIRGVGPQRANVLEKLGIRTAADLLFNFPRRYEDYNELVAIDSLQTDRNASVQGEVVEVDQSGQNTSRHVTYVLVKQENAQGAARYLRAMWFNQPYMAKKFGTGQKVVMVGKPRWNATRWEMVHPRVTFLGSEEQPTRGEIVPIYRLTDRLNQFRMRKLVHDAVDQYADFLEEVFPDEFLASKKISSISNAIRMIHRPTSMDELESAQERLVYQELLVLQVALAMRRYRVRDLGRAKQLPMDAKIKARILGRFPFEFSESQLAAVDEIAADMADRTPMNRLLQGDVGSGKTAVAVFAILLAVAHGHQAVLMAPTEILARQHLRSLRKFLAGSRVRAELWAGSMTKKQRDGLLPMIADGTVNVIIGTQAVIQSKMEFHSLALVVVDEQHKFGVKQRAALRHKSTDPHYLVMTATPIPRTVAMTAFGDLDTTTIERRVGSQSEVHTYLGEQSNREKWWDFFRKKLGEGRQGYVITPLVDNDLDEHLIQPNAELDQQSESDRQSEEGQHKGKSKTTLASAEKVFENLVNGPLSDFRVDLLHGRQSSEEKDAALLAFSRGLTQVLVATTVVEVGIDVPNATLMTIESAERFGLSQLHQLRGRVGRGKMPGYVCVFADSENPSTKERIESFVGCNDGFELAEKDFQLRGPGNLFSTQQHGMPPMRIADLTRDGKLLERSRIDARTLVDVDPELTDPGFERLKKMVIARYGKSLELSDVG